MNYKFLFIVTSSIIPFKVGSAHSPQERFEQTLNTIKSIREKVPNSIIWITESSSVELPEEYSTKLIEQSDYYVEHYDDDVLQQLYENLDKCPEKFVSLFQLWSIMSGQVPLENVCGMEIMFISSVKRNQELGMLPLKNLESL